MRSPAVRGVAGNCNLKGKKIKPLRCTCCCVLDFRDWERDKIAKKEIQKAKRGEIE